MKILIGGESHTGKTLLAQELLVKYKIPYTSLDHIKMGLVRGDINCGFTPLDSDDVISDDLIYEKMWGVVKGIIKTCKENIQNIILEGCYFPTDKVKEVICDDIIIFYLGSSKDYIEKNFDKVIAFENVIEKRKYPEERTKEEFISANLELKEKCLKANLPYFEINSDYKSEIEMVYNFINSIWGAC